MKLSEGGKLSTDTMAAVRHVAETYILPRYKRLAEDDVRAKSHPGDLVTVADEESERALTMLLPEILPGSLVIGEEAASADPKVLNRLGGDEFVWIVDPIDGTVNFVNGIARFAVMVALVRKGETLMGWIHDPVANQTLWAEKGGGAYLMQGDGAPVKMLVPQPAGENFSTMAAGFYSRDTAKVKGQFGRVVRLGSAAHDYWSLVDGRTQVLHFKGLKPWDHAAGILIHKEAGGFNLLLSRQEYSPAALDHTGILCAPNKALWEKIVAELSAEYLISRHLFASVGADIKRT